MQEEKSPLRTFIAELKRRHVFRVATVYLVAAWVVIQVATTTLPLLGAPSWILTALVVVALVGFPITLVVAWAFDLTREGIEVTDEPHRHVKLPWLRRAFAGVFVALVAAAGYALYVRVKPAEATRTPSVAVFPFSIAGSPSIEYLREGIVNLLATSLNGIGSLRSVDPTTLLNSLSESQRAGVDRNTAERIAREVGATSFIIGQIVGQGDGEITLTATLYDLANEKSTPNTVSVSGREDDILDRVDRLAGLLLTASLGDEASRLSRTAALTTNKLSALKAYLMGEAEYREARWSTAISFFRRAVEEDSTFALANYRLAVAADWASQFDTARAATARALRHSKRLSLRDRELLLAFNSAVRGRADEAEEAYRQITTDHPDDVEAWYRYGEVLYHYNPIRGRSVFESRPMFERAVRAAPEVEPMVLHLMELSLYEGDYESFDRYAQRIDSMKPAAIRRTAVRKYTTGGPNVRAEIERSLSTAKDGDIFAVASGLAQFRHDFQSADRIAAMMTQESRPPYVRGTGHLQRAQYHMARGRWGQAKVQLAELAEFSPGAALTHEALYAVLPEMSVSNAELASLRARLESWDAAAEPDIQAANAYLAAQNGTHTALKHYLLGLIAARKQDRSSESAARSLDAISDTLVRPLARRLASAVRAHAAYESGDYAAALHLLENSRVDANLDLVYNSVFWNGAYERYLRGLVLMKLDRHDEARRWFATLAEGRNEVFLAAPAQLQLSRIAQAAGQRDSANLHLQNVRRIWKDADARFMPGPTIAKK